MRLARLPGWVIDNRTSVRDEVAPFAGASMQARWEATRRCARAARKILAFNPDPSRALEYRDPLPRGTIEALARLRAARLGR